MTAREALRVFLPLLTDEPAVIATGFLSRTAQAVRRRPGDFHVIGSMGMVGSLALGIALAKPRVKVVAIDGDGSVLMNLGALPTAGAVGARNLVHVVIDNESYESTGGQPSFSSSVALERVAAASGYRRTARVRTPGALRRAAKKFLKADGPSFLLVKVANDPGPAAPRIEAEPEAITRTFSKAIR